MLLGFVALIIELFGLKLNINANMLFVLLLFLVPRLCLVGQHVCFSTNQINALNVFLINAFFRSKKVEGSVASCIAADILYIKRRK